MTDLEKLQQWLQTYPQWKDDIFVDFSRDVPGNVGIFPEGPEETGRRTDLLGNVQIYCRYRFVILRHTTGRKDGTESAQWLMDFQNWVLAQTAAGTIPQFGSNTRMYAQKGGLSSVLPTGIARYSVTLIAEFVKT